MKQIFKIIANLINYNKQNTIKLTTQTSKRHQTIDNKQFKKGGISWLDMLKLVHQTTGKRKDTNKNYNNNKCIFTIPKHNKANSRS